MLAFNDEVQIKRIKLQVTASRSYSVEKFSWSFWMGLDSPKYDHMANYGQPKEPWNW